MKQIWFFHWLGNGGNWENGYNSVYASSREEAILEIEKQFGTCGLRPNLKTLKIVTQEYLNEVDKSYSGYFD